MGSIYENALCTISAHAAKNSHDGCYTSRDPLRFSPCKLLSTSNHVLYAAVPRSEATEYEVLRHSRLSSRGWTFQETLLSARILHLGQPGIYWSCREGYATEIQARGSAGLLEGCIFGPSSTVSADKVGPPQVLYKHFLDMELENQYKNFVPHEIDLFNGKSSDEWADAWYVVVWQYSQRSLTKPEDKIVALSAVAQRIARLSGKRYTAGLWKKHFIHNLLWFIVQDSELFRVPAEYRGPSWSWVSVDGEIRHLLFGFRSGEITTQLARVIDISVSTHEIDTQETGRIFGASCTIRCSLASATELINRYASLSAKKKGFRTVRLNRYSYVNVYPDSTGYWPISDKLFLMPLRQIGEMEGTVFGLILQIDESETWRRRYPGSGRRYRRSGQRYRRVGAFGFYSKRRQGFGGWDHDIRDSRVLGTLSKRDIVII